MAANSMRPAALIFALILTAGSCGHIGMRFLTIEISVDGRAAFTGNAGVRDDLPVSRMWNVLPSVRFATTDGYTESLKASEGGECTVRGDVVVRIKHVEHVLATSSLSSLTLRRTPAGSEWMLTAQEAERIKRPLSAE